MTDEQIEEAICRDHGHLVSKGKGKWVRNKDGKVVREERGRISLTRTLRPEIAALRRELQNGIAIPETK
jgi:hypothetical protein